MIVDESEILSVSSDEEEITSEPCYLPTRKTIAKESIGYTLKTGLLGKARTNSSIFNNFVTNEIVCSFFSLQKIQPMDFISGSTSHSFYRRQ